MVASKRTKQLGINFTSEVKDIYMENCRTLLKLVEEDAKNGNISCFHGLEELVLLKCSYCPKLYTISAILIKTPYQKSEPVTYFTEMEK